MAKKKKGQGESKSDSKPKNIIAKDINKSVKSKLKKFGGVSKIKNKQNIKDTILSKSKSKQNIKDNIKSKFKSKNKPKKENTYKLNHKNQQSSNSSPSIKSGKPNSFMKKLNINKINALLNEKKAEEESRNKNQQSSNSSPSTKSGKPNSFMKKLNINKINALLNEKKAEEESRKQKKPPTTLSLRERMLAQLKSSRFRFLNEQMYSTESSASQKYFQEDPNAFYAYHEGYKQQVERWPVNPLDVIIESIHKMPKDHVIADFGCGEAKLADSVPQTVHSFDLVAVNDKVKACDMAHTPLLTGRVNVVVFCLSLMGSNLGDYLLEANRVLVKNGILKIAEVESRFNKVDEFIKLMTQYGFVNTWKDLSHNLFYFMDFKKTKDVLKKDAKKLPSLTLKPCLYKKR